jgi:serine/threonine protein kinase
MGCSSSSEKANESAWKMDKISTVSNPNLQSASPGQAASDRPSALSVKTITSSTSTSSSLSLSSVPHLNSPTSSKSSAKGPRTGLTVDVGAAAAGVNSQSNTPNKKMTLLQSRSQNSALSVQTSCHDSSSPGAFNTEAPWTPTLDPTINVVVPDDFRKKYKVLSIIAEKDIGSFAFRCTAFHEDEGCTSEDSYGDEHKEDEDHEHESDVVVYKGINRQKKYVIVEKTTIDASSVNSTIQIEFFDRIDLLRRISHVCVPSILDIFDSPQDYTVVFQYAVGKSLAVLMAQRGAMSSKDSIRAVVLALIDALKHMHKLHIAHRNITADHMILMRYNHFSRTKELKLTGLNRVVHISPPPCTLSAGSCPTADTASSSLSPSPSPMKVPVTVAAVPARYLNVFSAPELSQPNHTLAVDLYSLGVVIYSLINGAVPQSKSDLLRTEELHCTSKLKRIIKTLLHVDPAMRCSLRKVEKYFQKSFLEDNDEEEEVIDRTFSNSTEEDGGEGGPRRSLTSDEDQRSGSSVLSGSSCSTRTSVTSSSVASPDTVAAKLRAARKAEERTLQQSASQRQLERDDLSDC